ncbi:LysR family transcriptional regulator [Chitinophaga japonensis]|uniref:LysR family transcriptional regulator for metE and metH n=1 Tax=Chitinophaga japonensis TaxID=104662 RepID=A0A562T2M8_CHIJA|nr:LysR family transcriptional regulator [Chitinophaga japonensis]TWI87895.1 LysR family transcriptional regulator for metE and metH [Chitinophaga japonensis]
MEIRQLKLIKAIVEEGSITKAIDKLHLTQPALSHQLREAEYQLGAKIFHRINKKMVLTKAGEKVYALANDILSRMEDAETQIQKLIYGESGEIRLSTECYTSYHWLPALMKAFHLVYPNIDLHIVMEATHHPLQKLLAGQLDVAITSDPVKDQHISYRELFRDEMVAVVPDTHAWVKKKFVAAEDFATQQLIIHSLPMETVTVHQYLLAPAGVSPQKVIVLPLTEAAVEMVKAGMGITVMAKWAVHPYLEKGMLKAVKIGRSGLKRTHYAATLVHPQPPEYLQRFIEFLQSEIAL